MEFGMPFERFLFAIAEKLAQKMKAKRKMDNFKKNASPFRTIEWFYAKIRKNTLYIKISSEKNERTIDQPSGSITIANQSFHISKNSFFFSEQYRFSFTYWLSTEMFRFNSEFKWRKI